MKDERTNCRRRRRSFTQQIRTILTRVNIPVNYSRYGNSQSRKRAKSPKNKRKRKKGTMKCKAAAAAAATVKRDE